MIKHFRTIILVIAITLCAVAGSGETVTLDFSFDGEGPKSYTLTVSGDAFYINSWNTISVIVNGVDKTNMWVLYGECGTYTIEYTAGSYGHIEFRKQGTCTVGSDPTPGPTGDTTPEPTADSTPGPTTVTGGGPVLIEAEDYTSFYDSTARNVIGNQNNSNEAYDGIIRTDDVDIEDCVLGGGNICWVTQNEWVEYDLTNVETGTYNIWLRASNGGSSAGTAEITIDGGAVPTVSVGQNSLGDWQGWENVLAGTGIPISNGADLRITFTNSNAFNLDAIYLTPDSNEPPPTPTAVPVSGSVVNQYGSLQVAYTEQYGNTLCDQNGNSVQLRGFSLHHTRYHWLAKKHTIQNMANQFHVDAVRVTQYVESDMKGYLESANVESIMWERTKQYIRDGIAAGIYVIVDWHIHADQNEMNSLKSKAQSFFTNVSNFLNAEYGGIPNNIIWELYNEPIFSDWNTIKSFATDLISTIRGFDSDGIIICGTPNWCQNPDAVINNELSGTNIMYAIHFYAAQHRDSYRAYVQTALDADLPLFATEWGVCGYDPRQSSPDTGQSQTWMTLLNDNNISWANWSFTWKPEASSALKEGTWITGPWTVTNYTNSDSDLTESGWFVKQQLDTAKPASVSSDSTPGPTGDSTPEPTGDPTPDPTGDPTPESTETPAGGDNVLEVELESLSDQSQFSPFSVTNDSSASGGQAIQWPDNGNAALTSASDTEDGQVQISFTLSQTANVEFSIQVNMNNANNDSFQYKMDSGSWRTQNNTQTSGYKVITPTTFSNLAAGSHTLRILRREDGTLLDKVILTASAGSISGDSSPTAEPTDAPTPEPTAEPIPAPTPEPTPQKPVTVFAVNCGGAAYTSSDGTDFAADTGYSGGTTYSNTNSISGTTDDTLYQSERYGDFTYTISVPNGIYRVTQYNAETFHTSAGSRSFDVLIEGTAVITNLDLYTEAGGNAAYVSEADVTVSDGELTIQYVTNTDNAKICAIKVSLAGPAADFSYSPDMPVFGESVSFDASASTDPIGTIIDYDWDFGDGYTDMGITANHTYSTSGNDDVTFDVTLTITDDQGYTGSLTQPLTVYTGTPVADFSINPMNPKPGDTVTVDASASYDPNGTITGYQVEFGDGTITNGAVTTHQYNNEGTYTIIVTVTDNNDQTDSLSKDIEVRESSGKPRYIATSDLGADPDDEMSWVHFLVTTNEFDVEALVSGTSCWKKSQTSTGMLDNILNAYEQAYNNLSVHSADFPTPSYLRSVRGLGQTGYSMGAVGSGQDSFGSNAIIDAVDENDPRPVWVGCWGGANTVAQALWKVQNTRSSSEVAQFVSKLRVYDILGQDEAGAWITKNFPDLIYIRFINVYSWQYSDSWVDSNVQNHGPLGSAYPDKNDSIEGDSPAFMYVHPNGLSNPDKLDWGSWGGRCSLSKKANIRGMSAVTGESQYDTYYMYSDASEGGSSISKWSSDIANDFAARMDWSITSNYSGANHHPAAVLNGDSSRQVLEITASPGSSISLSAAGSSDPDGDSLSYSWSYYSEPSSGGTPSISNSNSSFATVSVPSGGTAHIILKVSDNGSPSLCAYRRVVINVN